MIAKKIAKRLYNAGNLAGIGAGSGLAAGYAVGGNESNKVPVLVKGKLKKGQKKAPSVQRAGAIGGLLVGAGLGLLRKSK